MTTGCSYYDGDSCRSCDLIELSYEEQLAKKHARLSTLIRGALGNHPFDIEPFVASPRRFGARNKAKVAVGGFAHAPVIGIVDESLEVRELAGCPLHHEAITEILRWLPEGIRRSGVTPYSITKRRGELKAVILRRASSSGSIGLRLVVRSLESRPRLEILISEARRRFPAIEVASLNLQPIAHAILEGPEEIVVSDERLLRETLGPITLLFHPRAFSQVNSEVARSLYERAAEVITESGAESLWDLYCGAGAFSMFAARSSPLRVTGIETTPESIDAARRAVVENGLTGIEFNCCSVEEFLEIPRTTPDAVLVNPPRAGLSKPVIEHLVRIGPRTVVYSSCNPETLARDLAVLSGNGAKVMLQPFDMFPHTSHMEVLAIVRAGGA